MPGREVILKPEKFYGFEIIPDDELTEDQKIFEGGKLSRCKTCGYILASNQRSLQLRHLVNLIETERINIEKPQSARTDRAQYG